MMEGWKEYDIEDFGDILTGTTPSTKKSEYYGGPYKFISPANLDNGKYINTSYKLLTEEGLKVGRTLPKNAILVGCIGNIGKIGMTVDKISSFNQQINAIICSENFDADFIYYLLLHHRPLLEKSAVKTTLPILNKGNFQKIKLQAPDLFIQRKIAYVLGTVQNAIEKQDQLIKTTTELKKALMQKLYTEGLHGEQQKETEIGLVPESWEVVVLGQYLLKKQYGISVKGSDRGETPILRMTNQKNGFINSDNLQYVSIAEKDLEKFKVNFDDVIFNRTNSYELVGRTAIFKLSGKYIFASYLIRLETDKKRLKSDYLNFYLNTEETQRRLRSIATRGVSQSNISATRLSCFHIPIPSIKEQEQIIQSIESIISKIKFHEKKKQNLTALFKTLLHELMTGQRRVHELEFMGMVREYKQKEQPLSIAAED
ncbi:MAG: restriction endonuclease subunit S [Bacteroidetes bacterium]|nr:restriction endonuclease subunit S [Bacteroidota bacterium]